MSLIQTVIEQCRPLHWVKNLLVFLPFLLAHEYTNSDALVESTLAFIVFSLTASAIYAINDVADKEKDLLHHRKKSRPVPSGRLSVGFAVALAVVLFGASVGISFMLLNTSFLVWVSLYAAATTLYSFWLKRIPLVDVLVLAGLFTVRIVAGGAATQTPVTPWLLMFSLLMFGSLAFLKRYIELRDSAEKGSTSVSSRGYQRGDEALVYVVGPAMGLMAVMVFMLYIASPDVSSLYTHPSRLWLIVPALIYWVSRLWLLAHRGAVHDDPIIVALKDHSSYAVAAYSAIVVVSAT